MFYDGYRVVDKPATLNRNELLDRVHARRHSEWGVADVEGATCAVLCVLEKRVAKGETDKVRHLMPKDVRAMWYEAVA